MNLRRLKHFAKIADIGSLTQIAEVLYIAQPALSQWVVTLEGETDQQLPARTKRGVTPTKVSKVLYTHTRTILRQYEQAQLAVNSAGQTLHGQISTGLAPGAVASAITMSLLQTVRNELPEVIAYLQEGSGTALNGKLLAGQLDMVVLYERLPVAGIVSQPLLKEDLYLAGTHDCPRQSVDLTVVTEMNLFLPRGYSAVRARVTEAFTLRRLSAKIVGEIESTTTLTVVTVSGMGATVPPESAARSLCGAASGWMARISTPSMSLSLSLDMSARGSLSPWVQAVKEILLSLVSRLPLENRGLQLVSQAISS